jgi:hypothetical protein
MWTSGKAGMPAAMHLGYHPNAMLHQLSDMTLGPCLCLLSSLLAAAVAAIP